MDSSYRMRTLHRPAAFTLVELLVIVSIIALLLALLLPALNRAKEVTRRTICKSSLQQMGQAMIAYTGENRGWTPNWPNPNNPDARNSPGSSNDGSRNLQHAQAGGPVVVGQTIAAGFLPAESKVVYGPSRPRNARYGPETSAFGWSNWERGATVEYSYQHRRARRLSQAEPNDVFGADLGIMDEYGENGIYLGRMSVGADVCHGDQFYNVSYFDMSVGEFIDSDETLETITYYNRPGRVLNTIENLDQLVSSPVDLPTGPRFTLTGGRSHQAAAVRG